MLIVPSNIGPPATLTFNVTAPPLTADLTNATGVNFGLLRRDGTQSSYTGSIVSSTPKQLVCQYTFAGVGEITTTGAYSWSVSVVVPGGSIAAYAVPMFVSSPFAGPSQVEADTTLIATTAISSGVVAPARVGWAGPVTPSLSPFAASVTGPFIATDSRTGAVTVTLWSAIDGDVVILSDIYQAAGTNSVTLAAAGGQLVPSNAGFASSCALVAPGFTLRLKYDAALTAWLPW